MPSFTLQGRGCNLQVGSGYSDQTLAILQQQLEPHWRRYKDDPPGSLWARAPPPAAAAPPEHMQELTMRPAWDFRVCQR